MPDRITSGFKTTSFWYNGEHERIKEHQADGSDVITLSPRYDTGLHFEKKYIASYGMLTGAVEYEHYLYAGGLMFGKYVEVRSATNAVTSTKVEYYTKDHLGSIAAITDQTGAVIQRLSYDVWGKRRNPNGAADPNGTLNNSDMYHGYTGHEMLDAVGLIHMNGRLYDPLLGRFVSADPNIQDPFSLESYNRYSYCWNNPLGSTDPSGYFNLRKFLRAAVAITALIFAPEISAWAGSAGVGAFGSAAIGQGLVGGGIIGYVSGGTLQSTLTGALSGAMFGGIGDFAGGLAKQGLTSFAEGEIGRAALHAAGGGLMSKAMGGDFVSGALAAGFAELAGPMASNLGSVGEGVARMVIGGTASVIGGGKFENGAFTAAYGYLFNTAAHRDRRVYAARDGEVNWTDWENPKNTHQGYGFNVQITSQDGSVDVYAHMQPDSITVHVGDNVRAGDCIGKYSDPHNGVGTGAHLHFERIDKDGNIVKITRQDVLNVIPGGVVTSGYGKRWHPVKHIWKLHEGIDKVGPFQ